MSDPQDPPTPPETGTPPADPPAPPADPPTDPPDGSETDPVAEVAKWKALARKNEDRAKENAVKARELEALKAAQMTETERAVAEAKAAGRAEALSSVGQRLAAAEIRAALTGIVPDPSAIAEDLDLSRYVDDDGNVDEAKVQALAAKYAAFTPKPGGPDLGAGNRGTPAGTGTEQLTAEDVKKMTPAEIVKARQAGRLVDYLAS